MLPKKLTVIITGLTVIVLIIIGFRVPKWVSNSYMETERGSFEAHIVLFSHQDDLRGIHPCMPYGYSRELPKGVKGCADGEDAVIVKSTCWFGVPGPKIRMCYKDEKSAELGSYKPKIISSFR